MIKMFKVLLVGTFDFDTLDTGGQPVKSRELFYALQHQYGHSNVSFVDIGKWKKNPIGVFLKLLKLCRKSKNIIFLTAKNGIKIIPSLLLFFKKRNSRIFYDVIGGWLPSLLESNKALSRRLQSLDGIWVETANMKCDMQELGFHNVTVVKNFKSIDLLCENELVYHSAIPLPLCTFSRVIKEKGINDAIDAVARINSRFNKTVYTLDIYGPVDKNYETEFKNLVNVNKKFVRYCGIIDPLQSVSTVKNYFLLLFPTHYFTEGIPGTIIDAYFSGVPVVAPCWKNHQDVIKNRETGLCYPFDDFNCFLDLLVYSFENITEINMMKKNCLSFAFAFTTKAIVEQIDKMLY